MSFPIPYSCLRYIGFGNYFNEQVSGVDAPQTFLSQLSPKNVFRLIFQLILEFSLSGGSVASLTLDLRDSKDTYINYLLCRTTLTAAQGYTMPPGDAAVDPSEFQGYPIPWFPDSRFRAYATTAGVGEKTTIRVRCRYFEWEILEV